jgi:mRNA-degrading endonuclease YafQ of YafQ-DinJ toxin-antitoxin module
MKIQNQKRLLAEEILNERRSKQLVDLREFLRRQAEQKKEAEMRERLDENQQEVRKVVGFLKSTLDRDNQNRDHSKEGKQKKLQERLKEIEQLHF